MNRMRTNSNHLDSNDCFIRNIKETKVDKIFIYKRYFLQALIPDLILSPAFKSYANLISPNENYLIVLNIGLNSEL